MQSTGMERFLLHGKLKFVKEVFGVVRLREIKNAILIEIALVDQQLNGRRVRF